MNNIFNIINNTPINPLTIPNPNINLTQMGKLDKTKPVILVDTSFWLYYRFFALRNWYKKAFPDVCNQPNFNTEHNWLEDGVFMQKYKKLFIDYIKTFTKKYKTVLNNVVFCIDCSHKDIWRMEHLTEYKGTRLETHKRNEFNSFNVFSYIKNTYLPELQVLFGIKILYNSKCEADDIIGQFAPFLINNGFGKVILIANDNDYLQICNENVIMISKVNNDTTTNVKNKSNSKHNAEHNAEYNLIKKILQGDVSDNIKCCSVDIGFLEGGICNGNYKNITKGNVETLLNNPEKYKIIMDLLQAVRNKPTDNTINELKIFKNFKANALLIDFQMLPHNLKNELTHKFQNIVF